MADDEEDVVAPAGLVAVEAAVLEALVDEGRKTVPVSTASISSLAPVSSSLRNFFSNLYLLCVNYKNDNQWMFLFSASGAIRQV